MPRKNCDLNCLECKLPKCRHDIEDQHAYVQENCERIKRAEYRKAHKEEISARQKEYGSKYYQEHKAEIDAKQKEYDRYHRNSENCHDYYMRHKEEINRKHRERYANNREARLQKAKEHYWAHREEISERRKQRRKELGSKNVL